MNKKFFLTVMAAALILAGCSHDEGDKIKNSQIQIETIDENETISLERNIQYKDRVDEFYNLDSFLDVENIVEMEYYGDGRVLVASCNNDMVSFDAYTIGTWECENIATTDCSSNGYTTVNIYCTAPLTYTISCYDGYFFNIMTGDKLLTYRDSVYEIRKTANGVVFISEDAPCEMQYVDSRRVDEDGNFFVESIRMIDESEYDLEEYRYSYLAGYDGCTDIVYIDSYNDEGNIMYYFDPDTGEIAQCDEDYYNIFYDNMYYADGYAFSVNNWGSGLIEVEKNTGDITERASVNLESEYYNYEVVDDRYIISYTQNGLKKSIECFDTRTMETIAKEELLITDNVCEFIYIPDIDGFIFMISADYGINASTYVLWDMNDFWE